MILGDCFQAAGRYLLNHEHDTGVVLVHGIINGEGSLKDRRICHAWIELDDLVVHDPSNGYDLVLPKVLYYLRGRVRPAECHYYTPDEAHAMSVAHGHSGPWAHALVLLAEAQLQ